MKRLFFIGICMLFTLSSCVRRTDPDRLINRKASLPAFFKLSELHQKVITSFINKRAGTMSILYGNEVAIELLQQHSGASDQDASFTLATWQQQDDPHWFGARIPGDLISVETLTIKGSNKELAKYQKYAGKNLSSVADTTGRQSRINFILAQHPSIIP